MELLPDLSNPKPTVLVVDDDPLILSAVKRVLRQKFDVLTAEGADAARAASEGRPLRLVLTDFSMPGENGVSLIRSLRRFHPRLHAVLITAVPETDEIRAAVRAGDVQHVLPKPWSPLALLREATEWARQP